MLLDQAVDDLAMRGQSAERRLFILPHEAAVAVNIGAEYGGELTFHLRLTSARNSLQSRLAQVAVPAPVYGCVLIWIPENETRADPHELGRLGPRVLRRGPVRCMRQSAQREPTAGLDMLRCAS